MDTVRIGAQVRYWRVRRGLNRQQFADRVGRSTSWLDKIESGERALLRLPMLETVAQVLGITVEALTDPVEADRAARNPDAAEVAATRGALGRYEVILGVPIPVPDSPKAAEVNKQLSYVNSAFLASNFSSIGRHLPKLIVEAQRAQESDTAHATEATKALVLTYRVASSTLLKLGANETAWLAADRAIHAAQRSQDPYCLARATRSVARAMTSLGQTAEALDALLAVARRMEPDAGTTDDETAALYGMVLLAAEISAAKLGDATTVDTMHEEAERLALHRFVGRNDSATAFGVTNVGLHRVAAFVRLGQGGRAIDYARTIDRAALEQLPKERRSTFLLDMAAAYTHVGQRTQAVAALMAADSVAPEEVRCRPSSRRLLATLIDDPAHSSSPELRMLAKRAGVQA